MTRHRHDSASPIPQPHIRESGRGPRRMLESSSVETTDPEPHVVERGVQQCLLACDRVRFSSLVIRRIPDGVCLQGIIEVGGDIPDVNSLAKQVAGVNEVINQLVVRRTPELDRV